MFNSFGNFKQYYSEYDFVFMFDGNEGHDYVVKYLDSFIPEKYHAKTYYITSAHNLRDYYKGGIKIIDSGAFYGMSHYRTGDADLEVNLNKRPYIYSSLNRIPKRHRVMLVEQLLKRNLLKDGFVTLSEKMGTISASDYTVNKRLLDMLPMSFDGEMSDMFKDIESSSYLGVVTESNYCMDKHDSPVIFITEKTYRTVINGKPFIILSNAGSLQAFKEQGFKTFSNWIDESYDNIDDPAARLLAVADEIERLCNLGHDKWQEMMLDMQDTLLYNYNHLKQNKHIFRIT